MINIKAGSITVRQENNTLKTICQVLYSYSCNMKAEHFNKGWFYNSASSRSPSWTSVHDLQKFLLREKGVGPFAYVVGKNALEEGDIIQLSYSFIMLFYMLQKIFV